MKKTDPQLLALCEKVTRDMIDLHLKPARVTSIAYNSRYTRKLGCCKKYTRMDGIIDYQIEISTMIQDSPELLANVVCHELIHTLPGCTGHGPQFKQAARRMRHKGYDIETRATEETLEKNGVEAPVIKTQPYRYALICQECGKMYKRKKWSKALEYPEHYRCTCGGHLKAYRLTEEPETGNPQ